MPTTNPLTTLREMLRKMTATGWEQISGKCMAIDRGEHPQVFRPLTAADEARHHRPCQPPGGVAGGGGGGAA